MCPVVVRSVTRRRRNRKRPFRLWSTWALLRSRTPGLDESYRECRSRGGSRESLELGATRSMPSDRWEVPLHEVGGWLLLPAGRFQNPRCGVEVDQEHRLNSATVITDGLQRPACARLLTGARIGRRLTASWGLAARLTPVGVQLLCHWYASRASVRHPNRSSGAMWLSSALRPLTQHCS